MSAPLDQADVIGSALRRGWSPDPTVQPGVTLADMLNQGDPYGRFWTTDDPRQLAHPADDGPVLTAAADAATSYLDSYG